MNIYIIFTMVKRYLLMIRYNINTSAQVFYEPTIQIFIWGLTSIYIIKMAHNLPFILIVLLTGVVFWTVISSVQGAISESFLYELWDKNIINIFASPLRVREWIISAVIVGVLKATLSLLLGITLAFIIYKVNLFYYGFLILPFWASLIITGWIIGFIISGIVIRFGPTLQSLSWLAIPVLVPFSAVYFPVSILPLWAQKVAMFVPTSYIFEGMREVIFTGNLSYDKLFISFALNIVYLILSIWFFVFMFNQSKKLGLGRLI